MACWPSAPAAAAQYTAGSQAELQAAITQANANNDPAPVITLTATFTVGGTVPATTGLLTINTNGFTLFGPGFSGGTLPYTLSGTGQVRGGDVTTGTGFTALSGNNAAWVINSTTVVGGGSTAGTGGIGASLSNNAALTNNGTITGGDGATGGGIGASVTSGSSVFNNSGALIQGGNSSAAAGGIGVSIGTPSGAPTTLTNAGTILGGEGATVGGVAVQVRTNNVNAITNTGTIQGGTGAAAILASNAATNLTIINSGTISAGAGANAIQLGLSGTGAGSINLELRAGSVINGNVVGGSSNADVLTLGGAANATFDVSTIGTQYQNFDNFQKTGTSTWTLTGTGTAVTNWVISDGVLQLGDGGTSGSIIGNVTNNSVFAFNRSDTLTYDGVISGTGTVRQDGTGTTVLTGANTYNGPTQVNAGTLRAGAAGAFSAASTFSVANGAQLDLAGLDQTVAGLSNGGLVTLNTPNGKPGTTLTVTGNYVGQGGTIAMNTYLGADGSPTDHVVINGNASGNTLLDIRNVGGPGALTTDNGIQLIQVNGESTADAFSLAHAVAVGAYDYALFYSTLAPSDDQSFYLRSTSQFTASAQTASPYADVLSNYAFASLGTLQQRNGNRIWPDGAPPQLAADLPPSQVMRYAPGGPVLYGAGAWGRIAGQYASYDPKVGSPYTQSLGFMQAGYEGVAYEAAAGSLSFGAYATVGTSRADIGLSKDPATGAARGDGHITTTAYGLGATTTWLGNDGLYADGIGQFTWYDSDLSNKRGGNNQGWSTVLSLEVGKRFELGSGWAVVPQAQLAWAHVDFDSFIDENDARTELGKGDSLNGRAGVRIEKLDSWKNADGQVRRLQLYGVANLEYGFLDGTSVQVAGTDIDQQNKKLWGEVGFGGSYAWNDKWSAYGEADYAHALSDGENYTVKGTAGLRYKW
jgi:fibronectin-binding autotransporter adhesin